MFALSSTFKMVPAMQTNQVYKKKSQSLEKYLVWQKITPSLIVLLVIINSKVSFEWLTLIQLLI